MMRIGGNRGVILFTAMMFILIMSIIGMAACILTENDAAVAVNLEVSRKAFYSAEAGVHFALASIQKGLKAGTLQLPQTDGATASLSPFLMASDPDINDIRFAYLPIENPVMTRSGVNDYWFVVRGYGAKNADADIRVTFRVRSAFEFGVFGNNGLSASALTNFYGYDSSVTQTPSGDDGKMSCDLGSNRMVNLSESSQVYGHIGLGNNGSEDAAYVFSGSPEPQIFGMGNPVGTVGRIDPDPLGVSAGVYADKFSNARNSNDNGMIASELTIESGQVVTLSGKPTGANYYFTRIELKNGSKLTIDSSAGPVSIYVSGAFIGNNGTIMHTGGDPSKLAIFSDKADPISLSHNDAFYGTIYAPYATLEMDNRAPLYGAILAGSFILKASGNYFFDTLLKAKYLTQDVIMTSWLDIRN